MSTKSIIQLSLFDNKHPECLNVASKWHFQLIPFDHNNQYIYSVLEWVAGMNGYTTDDKQARNAVARMKHSGIFSKNQHFINADSDNPEDIMATAQGLYLIAQNMRSRKAVPQIQAIKNYLAAAGVFADTARDNPQLVGEKLLEIAEARRVNEIKKYERAGLGNAPEIQRLKARHDGINTLKELRDLIAQTCENPNYAQFFDVESVAMFGSKIRELQVILNTKSVGYIPALQLSYLRTAEMGLQELIKHQGHMSMMQLLEATQLIVHPLGEHLKAISNMLGVSHITGQAMIGSGQ